MLSTLSPEEALSVVLTAFPPRSEKETVPLSACCGRVLFADIRSDADVPGFSRSTVDGYAVRASDTFGCSDAVPAILSCAGAVEMGCPPPLPVPAGQCLSVPTGGMLPDGADAVQMLEYCESYGDGTVGVCRSVAPGNNVIFRGDDAKAGQTVLKAGVRLRPQDVGVLAACGVTDVPVSRRPKVGILSTGDELVPVSETPDQGQVRNVNTALLSAQIWEYGAEPVAYPVVRDSEPALLSAVKTALTKCDMLLLSGGSSVGEKDAAARVLSAVGEILFHGVALKPGKPTLLANALGKPAFGLPGHPVAASTVARLFVRPLIFAMLGQTPCTRTLTAVLTENVSANTGRAVCCGVHLEQRDGTLFARPVRSKSGLITTLSEADGFFLIPRNCEGVSAGAAVAVTLYSEA